MSWLDQIQADRAISAILKAPGAKTPEVRQAVQRIGQIGRPAIPKLVDALARNAQRPVIEGLLADLVSDDALPAFCQGLCHRDAEVARRVAQVLTRSQRYDPNLLLDLFRDPECPKPLLGQLLAQHAGRLRGAELLRLLEQVDEEAKSAVLTLIYQAATPALVPQLTRCLDDPDPAVRAGLVKTLGRFPSDEVQANLVRLVLGDGHKSVRLAALAALIAQPLPTPVSALFQLLRDPDMVIQGKALEALVASDDPQVSERAVALLEEGSESIRRAAVEILNRRRPDPQALDALMATLHDHDWWVRERAADALAAFGPSPVLDRALPLLAEAEPELRQTLITLLRRLDDPRLFDLVLGRLEHGEPAARAGAVVALGELGDRRALSTLVGLLAGGELEAPVVAALAALGDPRAVPALVNWLESGAAGDPAALVDVAVDLADRRRALDLARALRRFHERLDDAGIEPRVAGAIARLEERFEHVRQDQTPSSLTVPAVAPPVPPGDSAILAATGPSINPHDLKAGELLAGRYRVIREIGRGGFGVVILVEDEIVQERMVLKFLAPHVAQDKVAIERFKHELRYARRITHENVIRIYDLLALGGTFAISMEYFASHSLGAELRRQERLERRRALDLVRAMCRGLAVAHREEVVHRDLKPGNVLIGEGDQLKIVDFGLAAAVVRVTNRLTRSGLLVGTPAYMAPEQIRGREIDARTDVYSLGVMMYELFTGSLPYHNDDPLALLLAHLDGELVPPHQLEPSLPESLGRIILKAMARDPADRHQGVEELARELETVEVVED